MGKPHIKPDPGPGPEPIKSKSAEERSKLEQLEAREAARCARIGSNVMAMLGAPPGFVHVEAKRIGSSKYRVNVRVELDAETELLGLVHRTRIAHSFYAEVDAAGDLLYTRPEIRRLYEAR